MSGTEVAETLSDGSHLIRIDDREAWLLIILQKVSLSNTHYTSYAGNFDQCIRLNVAVE